MEKAKLLEREALQVSKNIDVWHPYSQHAIDQEPILIDRAQGALLFTKDGKQIIDAISSWWVTLHGHAHPDIKNSISKQLERLEHVMFAGFTHEPAIKLAQKLLSILPDGFSKVFYSDNGSTAVETALKMAFQFFYNENSSTNKKKVIAFRGSYHGDTFGSMSVSQRDLFANPFSHALFEVDYIDPPVLGTEERSIMQMEAILKRNETACFIFEPIVQGASGMKKHSSRGLNKLIKLCQHYGALTIADEVMTGLGRLGPNFAIDMLNVVPDIICIAKGLTGGFIPLGATVCREEIFRKFLSKERKKAFLHGHSYAGNPLACASALASLELLDSKKCMSQREFIQSQHERFLTNWIDHPKISNSYVLGTLLSIEYKSNEASSYFSLLRNRLLKHFISEGILIRPLGNKIHILPPYCIEQSQLEKVYRAIEKTLEQDL